MGTGTTTLCGARIVGIQGSARTVLNLGGRRMRKVRGEDGSHRRELNLQRHFGKTNSPAGPVVSLVIGFAGWILAGRSLNADQDDVECRYPGGPN